MCVIIASRTGAIPSDEVMYRSKKDNPHGWGLMSFKEGQFTVLKGMNNYNLDLKTVEGSPYVLHLRWATHGPKVTANCHPFEITPRLHMAHNGVIDVEITNPWQSDSFHFAAKLALMGLDKDSIQDENVQKYLGDMVTFRNKLAFMDDEGRITLINEEMGVWDGEVWHSNNISLDETRHWEEEARYLESQLDALRAEYHIYRNINNRIR